jgi:hypothetical protein
MALYETDGSNCKRYSATCTSSKLSSLANHVGEKLTYRHNMRPSLKWCSRRDGLRDRVGTHDYTCACQECEACVKLARTKRTVLIDSSRSRSHTVWKRELDICNIISLFSRSRVCSASKNNPVTVLRSNVGTLLSPSRPTVQESAQTKTDNMGRLTMACHAHVYCCKDLAGRCSQRRVVGWLKAFLRSCN